MYHGKMETRFSIGNSANTNTEKISFDELCISERFYLMCHSIISKLLVGYRFYFQTEFETSGNSRRAVLVACTTAKWKPVSVSETRQIRTRRRFRFMNFAFQSVFRGCAIFLSKLPVGYRFYFQTEFEASGNGGRGLGWVP